MGTPPCWTGYVFVPDVDDYARRISQAGGAVHKPPTDIPEIGRFAVVADPTGAFFIIFKPDSDARPEPVKPGTQGHVGWRELHAGDGGKAMEFYSKIFGWRKTRGMDMGAMGEYQIFSTGGEEEVGGMMTKTPQAPAPYWMYYFNVEAIDAAARRVTDNGGKILNGPMEVPGGQWIVNCQDPQGAYFSLVAPQR